MPSLWLDDQWVSELQTTSMFFRRSYQTVRIYQGVSNNNMRTQKDCIVSKSDILFFLTLSSIKCALVKKRASGLREIYLNSNQAKILPLVWRNLFHLLVARLTPYGLKMITRLHHTLVNSNLTTDQLETLNTNGFYLWINICSVSIIRGMGCLPLRREHWWESWSALLLEPL